jgi:hypothetical protein
MKKSIIQGILTLAATLLTISGINAQKLGLYESKWHDASLSNDEESLINRMQFEEKSQFLILFTNDDKNLYIDLVMTDKAAIQKVMRFGLTTWFNPEGKHKKALGIQFPVAPEEGSEQSFRRDKGGDRKEMMMAMMDRKNQEMVLVGFEGKGELKSIDPRIDSSFHGKVEMLEGGKMHVSLALPLNKLGRSDENLNVPISAGFETGYLDLNQAGMTAGAGQGSGGGGDQHGGHYGGPPSGGGGPPPGGGQPSGGGTGGQAAGTSQQQQQPDLNELANPTKLWISQVRLAGKK